MLNWRYTLTNLVLFLMLINSFVLYVVAQDVAQNEQVSARVIVHYEGVAIQLAGAQNSPQLPVNSRALMSQGDSLITNGEGRALVMLDDNTHLLLLPNSRLEILDYRITTQGIVFEATLQGVLVQMTGERVMSYRMNLQGARIDHAGTLLGLWSFNTASFVANAEGQTNVVLNTGESIILEAGQVGRIVQDSIRSSTMSAPYNAARLEGFLDGCEAIVQTRENTGLLIRRGAGRGFERMNLIQDGDSVRVMALTTSGDWARVQYLNGFGWMQSLALEFDECTTLPRLPDQTLERDDLRVVNLRDDEQFLLVPFFGSPTRDIWFYRFVE